MPGPLPGPDALSCRGSIGAGQAVRGGLSPTYQARGWPAGVRPR